MQEEAAEKSDDGDKSSSDDDDEAEPDDERIDTAEYLKEHHINIEVVRISSMWVVNLIDVQGSDVPAAAHSFAHMATLGVPQIIVNNIAKSAYDTPSLIQVWIEILTSFMK